MLLGHKVPSESKEKLATEFLRCTQHTYESLPSIYIAGLQGIKDHNIKSQEMSNFR